MGQVEDCIIRSGLGLKRKKRKSKMCACGFPQSNPPHEHDRKPTIKELEDILDKPNGYYKTVIMPNGSIKAEPVFPKIETLPPFFGTFTGNSASLIVNKINEIIKCINELSPNDKEGCMVRVRNVIYLKDFPDSSTIPKCKEWFKFMGKE
jgi:hypothetical protein